MARKLFEVGGVILGWIAANLLGVAVLGALILFVPFVRSASGRLATSLVIGLPIGIAQWIALRRVAPISILWVLTISAGLLLALVVGPILGGTLGGTLDDESVLAMSAFGATIGLCVGLVQWLFLQGHFTKSLVWPLGSAVGLGLGITLILVAELIDRSGEISAILVALVYATATGFVVSWLRASHRKTERPLANAT